MTDRLSPGVLSRLAEMRDTRRVHDEITRFILMVGTFDKRATSQGIVLRNRESWRKEWATRKEVAK